MMPALHNARTGRSTPLVRSLKKARVLIFALAGVCAPAFAQNVTVNPGAGSYPDLKSAVDAINLGTHTGAITVSIVADTTETASSVLNASGTGAASYTSILVTPSGARTISGAIAAGSPLLDLNGADNVTIDGLNAAGNSLIISNGTALATSGTSTIRFIGGASNNVITNAVIRGSASMSVATNGGTIFFSTDGLTANGNDNNTISNNDIGPVGAALPTKGIFCNGTTTTTAIGNSGNIITNNNIFDFFGAAVTSAGVSSAGGCNTWTITNNRFFQTGTRTWTTGANHRAIDIANSTATSGAQGFTITGNTIGYASSAQTGTYTLTGSTGKFVAIAYSGITAGALTSISNNTIASVSLTGVTSSGTSTSSPLTGILVLNGLANTNSNTIGSQTATGSLNFNATTTTATDVIGIYNFSVDNAIANDNLIGGITAQTTATTTAMTIYGIRVNTGGTVSFNAQNNFVGGSVADSIKNNTNSTSAQIFGVVSNLPIAVWRGNTVRNLTTVNGTGTSASASVIGLMCTSGTPVGHLIESNTIEKLSNTNASLATTVAGIQFTAGTTTPSVIARNAIRQLNNGSPAGAINGINISGGASTYRNNMIRLGQDVAGADITTGVAINGVNTLVGTDNFLNNTILIQGLGVGGTANSFAMNHQTTVNTRFFQNNIFYNARSNAAGTGKHYAVRLGGSAPNPSGLTSNFNLFFTDGIGGVLGLFNLVDQANLAAWQAATGQDANSISANPALASATDLHLLAASPARNVGLVLASVTNDFDGDSRPGTNSLYDIGADEFDGIPPVANDMQATAFIDPTAGGAKLIGSAFAPQASFTNNGINSQANVTVRYRIVNPSSVEIYNQTVLIASIAPSITSIVTFPSTSIATAGTYSIFARAELGTDTVPANDQITGTFVVSAPLTGTYTVGTGGNYSSLTNNGGIFQALNSLGASANITVSIVADLSGETGTHALNEIVGGFTTRIQPTGVARSVTGASTAPCLVRLNGADNVTIDGALVPGGTTRDLTFNNTSTSPSSAVLCASSLGVGLGASNNTLKNLNVIGNDPTQTLIGISLGGLTPGSAGTNNDNNRLENNRIRRAVLGIFAGGASAANQNIGTVITRNDMTGTGVDRVRRAGILIFNDNGVQVTRNDIGGISTSETIDAYGIGLGTQTIDTANVTAGGVTNALVSRNRINGVVATSDFSAAGIAVGGGATGANELSNNMISGVSSPATPGDFVAGIYVVGAASSSTKLYFNSVSMDGDRGLPAAAQTPSYAVAMTGTDPTVELKNNIFSTTQTAASGGATAKSYAIGTNAVTFVNLDSNFNVYNSTGANAGFFRSGALGSAVGTDYATLAAWQAAISDDANSLFVDPLFTSTTDLHLQVTSPAQNIGTPIAGVTIDFDGDPRSAPAPEIGADEFPPPNTAPSITPTAGGITRQQDTAASNSQIAVVADTETAAGSLVVTTQTVPAGISVSNIVNTSGNITANVAASCAAATGANLVGLRVTDAGALFTDANLTVNVTANTAPVLGVYPSASAITGSGTTVTPNAAPTDNGTISTITASAPLFTGTFLVNTSTGVVTVSNAGPAAVYTVTVTATDACGLQSTATFQLTVSNANTAPTITPAAALTRQQGTAGSVSGLATVSDVESPAASIVVTAQSVPANLSVTGITNTAGAITGTVAAACTATVGANTVVLRATDPGTLFNDGNLTVNVTANTAPVQGTYGNLSVLVGSSGSTATPSAAPTDNGSVATVTAAATGGFTGSFVGNAGTGVITVNSATPVGVYPVTVTATDNCGTTSTRNFTLTVTAANTAPNIVPASVTPKAGDASAVRTIANVSDVEDAENLLVVTINGGASATSNGVTVGGISVNAMGIVSANVVATCSATNASFTLRVSDTGALFNEATVNTNVTANTAPTLSYSAVSLQSGTGTTVNPATGPTDSGGVTGIVMQSLGTYTGTASVNGSGVVTISNAAPEGSHTLTIRATDNCALSTDATLLLNVLGDNLFANGFEDVVRTPAQMKLPLGESGKALSLILPMFELQQVANAQAIVDVIEFCRRLWPVRYSRGAD